MAETLGHLARRQQPPPVMRYGLQLLGGENRFSIARARRELGFSPTVGLAEGVRRSVDVVPRGLTGPAAGWPATGEVPDMSTILVTGGNGFVGTAPGRRALQDRGDQVRVLALPGEDTSWLEQRGVAVYRGDIRDPRR